MSKVTFITPEGERFTIENVDGQRIREIALEHEVPGIVGECGGNCMCATCHVYVAEEDLPRLPPMSAEEDAMLDNTAAERRPNSRLGCQIRMTPELDGLTLYVPDRQL
jgi:2Fe-2S ferredoxin